ncbi:MAG: hypothetical protein ABID79_02860 [Elusimicrobiota bacterium]
MRYEVKKVEMKWVLTTMSTIFALVGVVIGIFTFFLFPAAATAGLGFGGKLLAWLIFVVLYTLIMVVGILAIVWLYNVISPITGNITFQLESTEE